jgi:tRNA dimethylallyltransferase
MKRVVLCIVGPTASGKSSLALLLAKSLHGEIISADSRQVYKYLDIGTAKPTRAQRREVKHHFVDLLVPDEDFNAGEFGRTGRETIDDIFGRKKVPIVVGGSGLYVKSLIDGFFEGPSADNEVRRRLYKRLQDEGAGALLNELRGIDPVSATRMLPSNTRRIVRALEVYELTGIPLSKLRDQRIRIDFTPLMIGLQWHRKVLYDRINRRVETMLRDGLLDEVRNLLDLGYSDGSNSLQTVGYQEAISHLQGRIDYKTMVELIKRNTRRYAKRQLTWFRAERRIHWYDIKDESEFMAISSEIMNLHQRRAR